MWPNQQFPVDLAKFTEKIINENFIFCAVKERKKNVLLEAVISISFSGSRERFEELCKCATLLIICLILLPSSRHTMSSYSPWIN